MNRSTLRTMILLSVPLLVLGGYLGIQSNSGDSPGGTEFVHPPIPQEGSSGDALLRAQAGDAPFQGSGTIPTSDNVTDSYYHEIFVLEERLKASPEDTLAMRQLGRLFQDGHKLPEAEASYTDYLARQPRARQVWLDLAAVLASAKKWSEAERSIDEMLEIYPGDASALYNLGAIAANSGNRNRAREIWSDLAQNSGNATVASMAASSLSRLTAAGQ